MASKRVLVGVLAGTLMSALLVGPAGAAQGSSSVQRDSMDRSPRTAVAAEALADRLPSGAGTFTAGPGQRPAPQSVTQILAGVRGHRDLDAWLGATADAIKATSGADVATASPPTTSEPEEDEEEYIPYTGRFAETYPAGDLDGDGLGDVVTYHWDVEEWTAVLEGRRGDTGALLWERAEDADGGLAWPLGRDLSGDGTADLLVYDLEILTDSLEDCDWEDDECWEQPWEATFRWTIGLVSGADGTAVWTRPLDGWITESSTWESDSPAPMVYDDEYSYELAGENLDVIPFIGDLNGNGLPEVILNAIDLSERFTGSDTYAWSEVGGAGVWEGDSSLESATRVDVVEVGQAAEPVLAAGGSGRVSLLWPIEQPDGSTDAVWEHALYPASSYQCAYAYLVTWNEVCPVEEGGDDAFEIVLLDGATFDEQWSTTVEGWGLAWPVGGDLDADGRNDIAAWTLDFETWEDRTQLLSGATGDALWDDDVVIRDVMTVGPLNHHGGDDVIAIDYTDEYSPVDDSYTFTLYLQRRDGATGELLGQTSYTAEDRPTDDGWFYELLYVTAGADGSGDAAPDLTVGKVAITEYEDDYDWWYELGPSSAVVESGATGEALYTLERDDEGWLFMADDFDGDGLTNVVEYIVTPAGDDQTAALTPVRITDATRLWTDQATGWYVFHTWGGDADGDGAAEVYRHVDSFDAQRRQVSTVVTALDGRTGTQEWSLVSRP